MITRMYTAGIVLFCTAALGLQAVMSQDAALSPGYLVLSNGDTLWGYIKDEYSKERDCQIVNYFDNEKNKVKIPDEEISSFQRSGEKYVKVSLKERPGRPDDVFMKEIVSGKVGLYLYYFYDKMLVPGSGTTPATLNHVPEQEYYLEKDGNFEVVSTLIGFRKQMERFFSDNEALIAKIREEKLKYGDIEQIVREYNDAFGE